MKISNTSISNKPLESYRSKNKMEKDVNTSDKLQDTSDTLSLSDKAKKLLEAEQLVQDISRQLEATAESGDSPYDELTKCLEIASRIMKGDKVPQADIRFLAEKQPELYSSAIFMMQNSDNPKRHKSLLEDEKDNTVEFDTGKAEIAEALADRMPSSEE